MSSIHLPNAVEPAEDVKNVPNQLPPLFESMRVARPAINRAPTNINVSDTKEVRAQLERIATLLDEGFKRSKTKIKAAEFGISAPSSGSRLNRTGTQVPGPHEKLKFQKEHTIVPSHLKTPPLSAERPVIGGTPIPSQLACSLRRVVYGSIVHSFSKEWRKSRFVFKTRDTPFQYGLATDKCGARGLILCVQAYILRHLVFRYKTKDEIYNRGVLQPSSYERTRALIQSLSQMLWTAGNRSRCCVCLPQERICFKPPESYRPDGITEKLHLFEFNSYEETEKFIKTYITYFEGDNGCILFTYSLVLSRTIPTVLKDSGCEYETEIQLLNDYEVCQRPLINLALAGRASRILQNGNIIYDQHGELLEKPLIGIPERGEVGFLLWNRDEDPRARTIVGSMLRTPKYPIWVTLINGNFGLLFALNPELVGDWRVEHRFVLRYYTGLITQNQDTKLTVDTRFGRNIRAKTAKSKQREEMRIPAVEQCIMSKWYGAEVDWHGIMPFI